MKNIINICCAQESLLQSIVKREMRETCRLEIRKYTFLFPIVLPEYSYYAQVEVLAETETNDEG